MNAPVTPLALARHYIAILHEELTPEAIAHAASLNTYETDPNIDHMADLTDTNEVLLIAWQRLTGTELEFNPEDTENLSILNATLELAKKADFLTSRLPTEQPRQ